MSDVNLFTFVNSITYDKVDMFNASTEKEYNSFMINRALSYYPDTVFYANEMNKYNTLDKQIQYDYLRHSIRKRKRFSKWAKPINNDTVELIMSVYNYNRKRAEEVIDMFSQSDIEKLKQRIDTGGVNGKK